MEPILMLIRSAPRSPNGQRVWQMAHTLHRQGHPVTLFLIEDGVLAAHPGETALRDLPQDIACYALREDLQLRGLASELSPHIQMADYAQLIGLFEENPRVMGAL